MTPKEILQSLPEGRREEALWLLMALLNHSRSQLLLKMQERLSPKNQRTWRSIWKKRMTGMPLQYAAHQAPFYGREFMVKKGVLIPRPETECLVELCLGLPIDPKSARVLDVGTGSGAIGISLALDRPGWEIIGTDISAKALGVAKINKKKFSAPITLVQADLVNSKLRKYHFDLVVSNPPYLHFSKDFVTEEVRRWEPRIALEPSVRNKMESVTERGAWIAERILLFCQAGNISFTALELSPRIAYYLERRWKSRERVKWIRREADLAGRKRFLLLAWKDA